MRIWPWVTIERALSSRRCATYCTAIPTSESSQIRSMPSRVISTRCLKTERRASAGLTGAELRLLPLLSTHLSFREIGEELFVSRNTIKTQAISVYRKLGVSSRSDAIDRAGVLGLLETAKRAI